MPCVRPSVRIVHSENGRITRRSAIVPRSAAALTLIADPSCAASLKGHRSPASKLSVNCQPH